MFSKTMLATLATAAASFSLRGAILGSGAAYEEQTAQEKAEYLAEQIAARRAHMGGGRVRMGRSCRREGLPRLGPAERPEQRHK